MLFSRWIEYAAMVASDCAGGQQGVSGIRSSGLERAWPSVSDVTSDRPAKCS